MRKIARIAILALALLLLLVPAACQKPAGTAQTTSSATSRKITLKDAATVLDLTQSLPSSFQQLNSSSEKMSNKDLGLGADFSEVQLFLSNEPYQMIFAYYTITESQVERATSDALLKDESAIKNMVTNNLNQGASEAGGSLTNVTVDITHPEVGDLSVLGSGNVTTNGVDIGYDILMFRVNKVYVFIFSAYLPGKNTSLVSVAQDIEKKINTFSQ